MILDIVGLVFVALFLVGGVLSGFLRQVVRLVALLGAFLLLSPLTGLVRGLLSGKVDMQVFPGNALTLLLGWLLGYLAIIVAGSILLRIVRGSSKTISGLDRVLGAALGTLKGGLIIYAVICVLLFFEKPMEKLLPELIEEMNRSRIAAFSGEHNLLSPWMESIEKRLREHEFNVSLPGGQ